MEEAPAATEPAEAPEAAEAPEPVAAEEHESETAEAEV